MRTGEIDGLKWRYVDFDRGLILVRETIVNGEPHTTKTYESARDIEISPAVCNALRAQRAATAHLSEYVFCNRDGKPLDHNTFTTRVWYPLLLHLSLRPRRPYQTRHTAATLWLSASGESPEWMPGKCGTPRRRCSSASIPVSGRTLPARTARAFERLLNSILPPSLSLGDHPQTKEVDKNATRPALR